jgi:hypothetical protein
MKRVYVKDIKIRDLDLRVTFKVKGDKKDQLPPTDEELKGKLVDVRI